MPVRDSYAKIIMESILSSLLKSGTSPTVKNVLAEFDTFTANNNISKPLFSADDFQVNRKDESSAASYNLANSEIQRDLRVLYQHILYLSNQGMEYLDRWRTEANILERRLSALEDRIDALLLISRDTAGYFNFVQDDFKDSSKTDLTETTARLDLEKGTITIGTSTTSATRLDLSRLTDKDLEFTVLSRNYLIATVSSDLSKITNAIDDATTFWQEKVVVSQPKPVSAEFKIKLGAKYSISRIDIDLHQSNTGSITQITPFYSIDNYNYYQLPIADFTHEVIDKSSFIFPEIEASEIKLVMTKLTYDKVVNNQYFYEFGFDEIVFLNEGYSTSTIQDAGSVFISKPLSVLDTNNQPENFSKVSLEICEAVPDGTSIEYYIGASNDSTIPIVSGLFTRIDPYNRTNPTQPTVIDFGELNNITMSGILVSYDKTETDEKLINPDKDFYIVQSTSGTTANIVSAIASAKRYMFQNPEDRVLNHVLASGVNIADGTLEIWRNVNLKGNTTKVRDQIFGWGFSDPWYSTKVYVENNNGMTIDFGGEYLLIDGIAKNGVQTLSQGKHSIQIHKKNWKEISLVGVVDLATLKSADSLYPYNHRYLVEGLHYPDVYPSIDEKIYLGFDIVAEYYMKEVSIFDMLYNVSKDDYTKFAIDYDMEDAGATIDSSPTTKEPMRNIVLKVNTSYTDFTNEQFIIKFKAADTQYKYLRFKAILRTTDSTKTPILDNYRIKVGN